MNKSLLLKFIAVLWVIWGLVHAFAGGITIYNGAPASLQGILDGVDPTLLEMAYHGGVDAIINQHGWNLGWFGVATIIGAVFVWRQNITAIWVTGMVGGMADLGYLMFVDIPGFVHFVPGTLMTFVSGTAVVLSFWVWWTNRTVAPSTAA